MAEHRRARRSALTAIVAVAALGVLSGLAAAALGDTQAPATTASAVPVVTVTAEPANDPITAPSVEPSITTAEVEVSPSFDLDARSIDDPSSAWVVVNKHRPLDPATWAPPELERIPGGSEMTPEAAAALITMRDAAADAGAGFSIGTAYRSHGFQAGLYADYVAQWGRERADTFSARAGHSEHQTGLAADVYQSSACRLKPCFGEEPAGVWISEHGHEYGFITRYPDGLADVTGYRYEPWHVRYVGVDLATHMHDEGIATLEELFGLEPAPTYQ
ncbi:M15 family metallopeptidase [Demequina activiva]|uniref:D-alanyl-D-alanine carboxypeptidase-like core domain-containing protein n=1 Tax=Demequina activiva TaxID=1582364 RepID=A0A919Q0D2_9MICO|nr:M15 family metallopeptidase [Demequina activiva]GIG53674.1 hypothetical protein Dac01nite_04260 [Demequina activiva]